MTLRCASCGRALRAYTVTVTTAAGARGYGPVCGLAIAPQQAKPKQAAPIIRFYAGRDNVTQPGQLALEFA
jgi:hypothetical protein